MEMLCSLFYNIGGIKMKNNINEGARRQLDEMPYDMSFDGGFEYCHATGYEVYLDGEWWYEYADEDGGIHYGR